MIEFLSVQYRLGKVAEEQLNLLVEKNIITEENKMYIINKKKGD